MDDGSSGWDRLADGYDGVMRLLGRRYPAVVERLVDDLRGARRVLEVACGTGLVTLPLAPRVPYLLATDLSPRMLDVLRRKLRATGAENVEVACRSAHALEVADGSFDAVVCVNGLHVIPAPDRALAEMARVLEPGGRLVIVTYCHGDGLAARAISRLMRLSPSFVVHTAFSRRSLAAAVERAGFVVERVEDLGEPLPLVYVAARRP